MNESSFFGLKKGDIIEYVNADESKFFSRKGRLIERYNTHLFHGNDEAWEIQFDDIKVPLYARNFKKVTHSLKELIEG